MINRKHTGPYEHNINSKRVEYSTAVGPYCTTYDVKVLFFLPEFSSRKIILHHFHVDNNNFGSDIGYEMIIICDLMVYIGLMDYFKRQVLQWYSTEIIMKEPRIFLGHNF